MMVEIFIMLCLEFFFFVDRFYCLPARLFFVSVIACSFFMQFISGERKKASQVEASQSLAGAHHL
jgi:hypothetical protein